jgi:hypothetical protein
MKTTEAPDDLPFDEELHRRIDEVCAGSVVLLTMADLDRRLDEIRAKHAPNDE